MSNAEGGEEDYNSLSAGYNSLHGQLVPGAVRRAALRRERKGADPLEPE
ncbi:hypothetical protein [Pyrofollis japonicus]|nr:hypothetical protein [Pyrofollis japonicus]